MNAISAEHCNTWTIWPGNTLTVNWGFTPPELLGSN